jgi:hypothetical protein
MGEVVWGLFLMLLGAGVTAAGIIWIADWRGIGTRMEKIRPFKMGFSVTFYRWTTGIPLVLVGVSAFLTGAVRL